MASATVDHDGRVMPPGRLVRSSGPRAGGRLEVERTGGGILPRTVPDRAREADAGPGEEPPSPVIEEHTGEDAGALPADPAQPEEPSQEAALPPNRRARGGRGRVWGSGGGQGG